MAPTLRWCGAVGLFVSGDLSSTSLLRAEKQTRDWVLIITTSLRQENVMASYCFHFIKFRLLFFLSPGRSCPSSSVHLAEGFVFGPLIKSPLFMHHAALWLVISPVTPPPPLPSPPSSTSPHTMLTEGLIVNHGKLTLSALNQSLCSGRHRNRCRRGILAC